MRVIALAILLGGCSAASDSSRGDPAQAAQADLVVSQLKDTLSPLPPDPFCASGIAAPDGTRDRGFVCPTAKDGELRDRLYTSIAGMGAAGAAALGRAYSSPDVRLRRAAALALEMLGGGYDPRYAKLDVEPALPALIDGLRDEDDMVRAWSAQAFASLGSRAASAVPELMRLLGSASESDRNSACIGLGDIGPTARAALPALTRALSDPSPDVRGFAQRAIQAIGT